jgi:flagellar FliJ protein
MPRPFPLHSLLEHARHRLEAAERLMRYQKRKEEEARQRMAELIGYRGEYQARLGGTTASGMDIHMLRDYHQFLAKLAKAIEAQEEEVRRVQAQWRAAHGYWTGARAKVKAYEVLAERHRAAEVRRDDKLDQARMDELVNRRVAAGRRAGEDGEPH